ncbi:hypothetical protein HGRIS_009704 [Hohenbuehelia grisea]|uniref:Uncharacterized protein n=1 Tax=Hohenbuehelia grisea TaxID=104357 RepID=A0ABR3J200_9AGAR
MPRATPTTSTRQVLIARRIFGLGGGNNLPGDDDDEENVLAGGLDNNRAGIPSTPALVRPTLAGIPTETRALPPPPGPLVNLPPVLATVLAPSSALSSSSTSLPVIASTTSTSSESTTTTPNPVPLGVAAGANDDDDDHHAVTFTSIRGRPVPIATSVFETSSGGHIVTVTSIAPAPSSTGTIQSNVADASATPKTFLQNKPLSSFVFTLVGLVGIALISLMATCLIRRRRRKRLMDEAISFDPTSMGSRFSMENDEKDSRITRTDSMDKHGAMTDSDNGHPTLKYNPGAAVAYAYAPGPMYQQRQNPPMPVTYADPQPYHGSPELAYAQDMAYGGFYEPTDQLQHGDNGAYGGMDLGYANNYHGAPPPPLPLNHGKVLPPGPPSLPAFNFISASPPASERFPINEIHSNRASVISAPPHSPMSAYSAAPATVSYDDDRTNPVTRSDSTATSAGGHSVSSYESVSSTVQGHTYNQTSQTKQGHGRSHSRDLDPHLPRLPVSPRLPPKFGMSEEEKRGSVDEKALLQRNLTLKVANE